jgi:hypothetical protein
MDIWISDGKKHRVQIRKQSACEIGQNLNLHPYHNKEKLKIMTKKKSGNGWYIDKSVAVLLTLILGFLTLIVEMVKMFAPSIVNNIFNYWYPQPVAQATWHTVETWTFGVSTTATMPTFDLLGFVSSCLLLGTACLVVLHYSSKKLPL